MQNITEPFADLAELVKVWPCLVGIDTLLLARAALRRQQQLRPQLRFGNVNLFQSTAKDNKTEYEYTKNNISMTWANDS